LVVKEKVMEKHEGREYEINGNEHVCDRREKKGLEFLFKNCIYILHGPNPL
jgi:hypothetical protein